MKKEILMLIIGILIGAIIATGVFLVLQNNSHSDMKMDRGEMPASMDGNMVDNGGQMREKPNNENTIEQETTTDSNESNS